MNVRGAGSPALVPGVGDQLYRFVWPVRGSGNLAAFQPNWAAQDGAQRGLWAGVGGAMASEAGLPGARKSLDQNSVFDGAGVTIDPVLPVTAPSTYRAPPHLRALAWRTYVAFLTPPDLASEEFGLGVLGKQGVAADPLNAVYLMLRMVPGGGLEIRRRATQGGPVTTVQAVPGSAFPLGTTVPTLVEWWFYGADRGIAARVELWIDNALIAGGLVPPASDTGAGDTRYAGFVPFVAGGAAPQLAAGQLWHGPCDLFYSLRSRSGALL